jgi:hypothetical protein
MIFGQMGGGFGGGMLGGRSPMPQPIQYPRPVSPVMPRQPIGGPVGPMPVRPVGPAQPMPDPIRPVGPARLNPALGQMHKGGKVTKTGSYILKKGEHVLPKGKSKLTSKIRNQKPQKMVSVGALKA